MCMLPDLPSASFIPSSVFRKRAKRSMYQLFSSKDEASVTEMAIRMNYGHWAPRLNGRASPLNFPFGVIM